MSQFNFNDYQKVVTKAQSGPATNSVKIGFFKLAPGAEALVRIDCSSLDSLKFATVHAPAFGKKFEGLGSGFTPVSCLNEVGSYSDSCPFCKAAAEGHEVVGKAAKKVYVQMLVSYKDASTGQWAAPLPVVWERPAGFSTELAAKLNNYGDLRKVLFKVTRIGAGKDTKYSFDYAMPAVFKPELVPEDFSAFDNFSINKHSYWEKSAEELQAYLDTGSFPAVEAKQVGPNEAAKAIVEQAGGEAKVEEALFGTAAPAPQPAPAPVATPVVEQPAPAPAEEKPVRNFSGFSF